MQKVSTQDSVTEANEYISKSEDEIKFKERWKKVSIFSIILTLIVILTLLVYLLLSFSKLKEEFLRESISSKYKLESLNRLIDTLQKDLESAKENLKTHSVDLLEIKMNKPLTKNYGSTSNSIDTYAVGTDFTPRYYKYQYNLINAQSTNSTDQMVKDLQLRLTGIEEFIVYPEKREGIALCTWTKNEEIYIQEFLDYYKNMGVVKVYLYDNNDANGEKYENYIKKSYLDSGFVEILDYRGTVNISYFGGHDCMARAGNKYDWVMVYDIDEFLYIKNNLTIFELLNLDIFKKCDTIRFNWKVYGDSGQTHYENKPVLERFTKPMNDTTEGDREIKTIIRGRRNIRWGPYNIHSPKSLNQFACNGHGEKVNFAFRLNDSYYNYAYIKHFRTKSTEEYINKTRRGWPGRNFETKHFYKNRMEEYFRFNEITLEKIEMVENALNITLDKVRKKINATKS